MNSLKPNNVKNFNDKKAVNPACKKHPKHRQAPGVCSICLGERLSQLPNIIATSSGSSKVRGVFSSLSSSNCSDLSASSNASLCSSPVVNYTCRVEYLEAGKPMKVFKNVGQNVLKKSRSMVYSLQLQRRQDQEGSLDDDNGRKNIVVKRGFWSKLLPRKGGKALRYSRTMRERVAAEVH